MRLLTVYMQKTFCTATCSDMVLINVYSSTFWQVLTTLRSSTGTLSSTSDIDLRVVLLKVLYPTHLLIPTRT